LNINCRQDEDSEKYGEKDNLKRFYDGNVFAVEKEKSHGIESGGRPEEKLISFDLSQS
jgi:hypothetical protein